MGNTSRTLLVRRQLANAAVRDVGVSNGAFIADPGTLAHLLIRDCGLLAHLEEVLARVDAAAHLLTVACHGTARVLSTLNVVSDGLGCLEGRATSEGIEFLVRDEVGTHQILADLTPTVIGDLFLDHLLCFPLRHQEG